MSSCVACLANADPASDVVLRTERFVVQPVVGGGAVPGWLVVAPLRHVEAIDLLDPEEQAELGPLLARVGAALRAVTSAEKLYVSVFAEVVPHFHVHLVARPADLPAERRGPRLFLDPARAAPDEVSRIAAAVRERLQA